MRPFSSRFLRFIAAPALATCALHCGASTPPPPVTASSSPPPATVASQSPASSGPPADPLAAEWAHLSTADLAARVTTEARARLAQLVPTLDLDHLTQLADHPESAPELPGKATDRLLDLAIVALALDHPGDAAAIVRLVRARARNRNSAFVGNTLFAEATRRLAGNDDAAQQHAVEAVFTAMPPMRFNAATVFYQLYQRPQQLEARIGTIHRSMVSLETARDALFMGVIAPVVVAHRDAYLATIERVRTANASHPARAQHDFGLVDLTHEAHAHEVNIAVWDLGVNPELFASQLFTNPNEQPNGRDDDGNGQIDDIHGIVSDATAPNTALMYDPGADTVTQYSPYLRGVFDLRAGLSSTPAAQQVLTLVRGITSEPELRALEHHLDAIGEWAHGTHVAGIMTAGVPQARLAIFRSAWAGERRVYDDRGPTDAELSAEEANMNVIADFIQRHHIRVVNASLGFEIEYLEGELRHETALYHSNDEIHARAEAVQARRRAFWQAVFTHCPDTLFVVAAGNSNEDIVEYGDIPAGINAPNLLTVGAVDRFGDWAQFTNSNPDLVRVFGYGVEVDSVIPNGQRVPLSGTSMASPHVANLATKLLALDPRLTPARIIQLITESGDVIAPPFNGHIANQAHAVIALRRPVSPARAPVVPHRAH